MRLLSIHRQLQVGLLGADLGVCPLQIGLLGADLGACPLQIGLLGADLGACPLQIGPPLPPYCFLRSIFPPLFFTFLYFLYVFASYTHLFFFSFDSCQVHHVASDLLSSMCPDVVTSYDMPSGWFVLVRLLPTTGKLHWHHDVLSRPTLIPAWSCSLLRFCASALQSPLLSSSVFVFAFDYRSRSVSCKGAHPRNRAR